MTPEEPEKREAGFGSKTLFGNVESRVDEPSRRARTITIWLGLFVCAILVSQFGRPSRAREAEFMRGAAKIEKLGSSGSATSGDLAAVKNASARVADEKELTPAVYTSRKYGLAWQYPRNFVLRRGANAGLDLSGHYATPTAFAGDGGVTLASVIIPGRAYAGSDFLKASLTARVNPRVSEDACGRIRISDDGAGGGQRDLSPSEITVGTTAFSTANVDVEGDSLGGAETREKFFHLYENAACYEFAMSVTIGAGGEGRALRHVEADEVFERLEEILTSVTIVPVRGAEDKGELPGAVDRHK